ncbi:MAG TPA: hypothetical protein VM733_03790 [Thermoanaerobaculia bacterium]|nr:hypothetical protein [Thermoanaerobaculia bacterium]
MGNVRKTRITSGGRTFDGEALLETSELIVRGEKRVVIPFASMRSIEARDGHLIINDDLTLDLGDEAAKWAEKIRNPKSVVQKLGVKSGHQLLLVNLEDSSFVKDLEAAGAVIGKGKNRDAIFYGADTRDDLSRLAKLRESLAPNGSLWVIRPKGIKAITESDVMAAGKAAGLVDVKVVKFSETHTAEKFVIRVADRAKQ